MDGARRAAYRSSVRWRGLRLPARACNGEESICGRYFAQLEPGRPDDKTHLSQRSCHCRMNESARLCHRSNLSPNSLTRRHRGAASTAPIIRRESHWQSRIQRKRARWPRRSRKKCSLGGQLLQLLPLTDGNDGTIRESIFSLSNSETY